MKFHPLVRSVQKIVVYETKTRFYIVGSNEDQSKFRVLKIDRTDPKELVINDDKIIYNEKEIRELLTMIDVGNRSKVGQKMGSGFNKTISSYGIIGFVRFLEGYYMILITSRLKAAMLGHHSVFKIADTAMVYIPNEEVRETHPDESRYVKMFQAIDLSSNFYYSYSYDLTNTVQYNMEKPSYVTSASKTQDLNTMFTPNTAPKDLAYLSKPNARYVWNEYLTDPVKDMIHHDWILNIIHGFVDQANISVYGSPILLTLVARRSCRFAGTRFLKRGANYKGDVANEVETEQIVVDSTISNLDKANVTSFVQIRGSVPGQWSQDTGGHTVVPKPQIYFQNPDPTKKIAGKHFNKLLTQYGSPVVILDLVKKKEKYRKHESLLADYMHDTVSYLNTFLHEENHLHYTHFDMARCSKNKDVEVMTKLAKIAERLVNQTGIYHSQRPYYWQTVDSDKSARKRFQGQESINGCKQTGIVRTNCVDCLDRTNTAQFVIGKIALGMQLYALGYISEPHIQYDTDCSRMLEAMFEDHGDTLALQYGGSQLIHRIKSYRKESKWTNKANDITQTLRRYYSNALTDTEKQNTMNLFLGVFVPHKNRPALWERDAPHDVYLHAPEICSVEMQNEEMRDIEIKQSRWWDIALPKSLPFSLAEKRKECLEISRYDPRTVECDLYVDNYHPQHLTVFSELFSIKEVSHSVRDYMPNCETDYSPFVVRQREVKRREDHSARNVKSSFAALLSGLKGSSFLIGGSSNGSTASLKNPSVAATSSTASNTSQTDQSSDDEDLSTISDDFESMSIQSSIEDSQNEQSCSSSNSDVSICDNLSFPEIFLDTKETYGFELKDPNEEDMEKYKKFLKFDGIDKPRGPFENFKSIKEAKTDDIFSSFDYNPHDYTKNLLPKPSEDDMKIYQRYVTIGKTAQTLPTKEDLELYMNYLKLGKTPTDEDWKNYNELSSLIQG